MFQKIVDKLLSGRWIATVSVVLTYCFIVGYVTVHYCMAITKNAERLESFAMGLIVGFSGTASLVLKSYFDDRKSEQKQGGQA